ncbi:hypothetical protein GCM10007049_38290 [Echinicola pacifica]|uniref:Regulator of chromosome condensation (RCC1) repeat-containing protein n=1 Tax=Echinicola pacifica TaxID=346377 RepID=A0A918QDS1_9BACT|nr:hypothetical protein [Echinicola pacifica]GGZ41263.1 hypothetical protein GCM10007049_38290 [Echinicola pacifica]
MKRIKLVFLLSILSIGLAFAQAPCNDPTSMGPDCDFDGDGIINSLDLDDDNDGVLDVVERGNEVTEFGYKEDILVAGFHGVLGRTADGGLMGWGEYLNANGKDHLKVPTEITPANGYNYEGNILKFTYATTFTFSSEAIILTEAGLYAWGNKTGQEGSTKYYNTLIPAALRSRYTTRFSRIVSTSTYGFGSVKNQYSLPADYQPSDVEVLDAVTRSIYIVTKDGKLWVMGDNEKNYGDNSGTADALWHEVQFPEGEEVYKIKGSFYFSFAQTKSGNLYTWGSVSIVGDGTAEASRVYPTKMVNPLAEGERIVQIGTTLNGYFILSSSGHVYSMGNNTSGETGRGLYNSSTKENKVYLEWGRVTNQDGSDLENVRFLSAQDKDTSSSTVAVILEDGSVRAWGSNDQFTIGGPGFTGYNYPIVPAGTEGQQYTYVETGAHITPIIKADGSYCNVGHDFQYAFGDGSSNDERISSYQCILPAGTFKFMASNTIEENTVDTDGDGVPNSFDLDSDGDGCPDSKESGLISYMEGINGATSSPGTTTNGNGTDATSNTTLEIEGAIVGTGTPVDYGENGFYNLIETLDDQDAAYSGIYTYTYAIDDSESVGCVATIRKIYSNPAMRSIKVKKQ